MEVLSKAFTVLMASSDSVSGEIAGDVIERLYATGAVNVQVISSITKKNRPAHVFLVECKDPDMEGVEACLVRDLGVTGWHRIRTEHCFVRVEYLERTLCVQVEGACEGAGGASCEVPLPAAFSFQVRCKYAEDAPRQYRPEMDSCVELRGLLSEKYGLRVSLQEVQDRLAEAFANGAEEVRFSGR